MFKGNKPSINSNDKWRTSKNKKNIVSCHECTIVILLCFISCYIILHDMLQLYVCYDILYVMLCNDILYVMLCYAMFCYIKFYAMLYYVYVMLY